MKAIKSNFVAHLAAMKSLFVLMLMLLLTGCLHLPSKNDFVQGWTRITPPIQMGTAGGYLFDGGTRCGRFTDAKGRVIDFYIDDRIDTKTPGDIYLYHYPDQYFWSHVRIKNKAEFIRKLGHEESFR
ncbi:MAG: hypothetical protein M9920_08345 [Verrucomicrobiae bacterium]|nr:hypothetical protein [Verrucomicrobiae bacterium]